MRDASCELCRLCDGDIKTKVYYDCGDYIIVDCLTCGPGYPMIVYKSHEMPILSDTCLKRQRRWESIGQVAELLVRRTFGDKFKGFRKEQKKIHGHWHWHILLKE